MPSLLAAITTLALATGLTAQSPAKPVRKIPKHTEIRTLVPGLQLAELQKGEGTLYPHYGDKVLVHLTTWLADGKLIETTVGRKPAWQTVGLNMLPGLAQGMTRMRKGGRYKLIAAPELCFGERPGLKSGVQNNQVPPNSTLVYEVVVLDAAVQKHRLPKYEPVAEDKLRDLKDGLRYAVLKPGTKAIVAEDRLELHFALFNSFGMLLATDADGERSPLDETDKLKFLELVRPLLVTGARCRFVVPPELCYGRVSKGPLLPPDSVTIWDLEVAGTSTPLPVPDFARPAPGSHTTGSGLRYEVVKPGKGNKPKKSDSVHVHFAAWLSRNGKLFDSSYEKGKSVVLDLRTALAGLGEGLPHMQVGSTCRFSVPGHLAYGVKGRVGQGVGPNATVIFHVELIEILRGR